MYYMACMYNICLYLNIFIHRIYMRKYRNGISDNLLGKKILIGIVIINVKYTPHRHTHVYLRMRYMTVFHT